MESFEMKITVRGLAERSGTSVNTVRKYLEKIGFKKWVLEI